MENTTTTTEEQEAPIRQLKIKGSQELLEALNPRELAEYIGNHALQGHLDEGDWQAEAVLFFSMLREQRESGRIRMIRVVAPIKDPSQPESFEYTAFDPKMQPAVEATKETTEETTNE